MKNITDTVRKNDANGNEIEGDRDRDRDRDRNRDRDRDRDRERDKDRDRDRDRGLKHADGENKKVGEESNRLNNGVVMEGSNKKSGTHKLDLLARAAIKAHRAVLESGLPNYKGCRIPVPTKLNTGYMAEKLQNYEDRQVIEFIRYGWPINYQGEPVANKKCKNHKGAKDYPKEMDSYLRREVTEGATIGPFEENPLSCELNYSPLNSRPKRESEERRVILDLSYPSGSSVNDGIPSTTYLGEACKLQYPSVDSLVELIKQKGRGCALYKRDLRRAYRQFHIDPGDMHLMGFTWNGKTFIDVTLAMGLRSAASVCQRLTNAVTYIVGQYGVEVVNYLDDLAGAEGWDRADEAFQTLGNVLERCGIIESVSKACSPSCRMVFLGVQFDTTTLTLTVTKERMVETLAMLEEWKDKVSTTRKEVEQLIGKLNYLAACIRPGRVFISRLLNFLRGLEGGNRRHGVPLDFKKDIRWWLRYLSEYNGVSMIAIEEWEQPDKTAACDACLAVCGG